MEGQVALDKSPPSWIDADFVQTALRNGEDDSTIIVTKCDVTSKTLDSKFAADVYHAVATLETGEERSIIVKCRAEAGPGSKISELFDTEVKMLTETLPAMEKLLETACPEDFQPFSPKYYYHGNEPLPFVVLEDPSQDGFNYYRFDVNRCRMALRTLARFHAASIAFLQQNPEELEYFCKRDFAEKFRGEIEDFIIGGIDCLANEVKNWSPFEEYAEKLLRLKETICEKLGETLKLKEGSLNCLIRPDSSVTNMMFKISENTYTGARMTDFQSVIYGSPVIDVLHCLFACLDVRIHIFGAQRLINEYYLNLQETLRLLGHSDLLPSMEDFQELVSQYKFYDFYLATSVLPLTAYSLSDRIDGDNIENASNPQDIKSILYKGHIYKSIMQCLLCEYDHRGIFDHNET